MGKGCWRRPSSVSRTVRDDNYDKIFRKKKPKEEPKEEPKGEKSEQENTAQMSKLGRM